MIVAVVFVSYHKFPFKSRYLIKEEKKGRRKETEYMPSVGTLPSHYPLLESFPVGGADGLRPERCWARSRVSGLILRQQPSR